jgi:hypothetical protein
MANATVTVFESDGVTETDVVVLDVGRQAAAASKSLATCTEDKAVLDAIAASLATLDNVTIKDSAATGTDQGFVVHLHPDSVNANGQTTMSSSAPVAIASDQSDVPVNPKPATSGGLSIFRSIDLDEGTLEVVKASAGQVYGMWVTNTATATRFVKFYNATSGTLGTGTPVITVGIPGNSSDDVSGLFSSTHGIAFSTGICVGAGTGVADNDTGAPGANEVIVNIFYK